MTVALIGSMATIGGIAGYLYGSRIEPQNMFDTRRQPFEIENAMKRENGILYGAITAVAVGALAGIVAFIGLLNTAYIATTLVGATAGYVLTDNQAVALLSGCAARLIFRACFMQ